MFSCLQFISSKLGRATQTTERDFKVAPKTKTQGNEWAASHTNWHSHYPIVSNILIDIPTTPSYPILWHTHYSIISDILICFYFYFLGYSTSHPKQCACCFNLHTTIKTCSLHLPVCGNHQRTPLWFSISWFFFLWPQLCFHLNLTTFLHHILKILISTFWQCFS